MKAVCVIGGGPAGLMAAETIAAAGLPVTLFDRMPQPGRKLLMAGRGGLNLTHSEALPAFLARYGPARDALAPAIAAFPPEALRDWCHGLGEATFVGSSGRVFPTAMKAAPLLRAWLARLASLGVGFRPRHRWLGWDGDGALRFETPDGETSETARATVLALGGASWPRLGSDGRWVGVLRAAGVTVRALSPANAGVAIIWSSHLVGRFAGTPLKRIAAACDGVRASGEAMLTASGLEGGAIYALGPALRAALRRDGVARLVLDLRPDLAPDTLASRLAAPRRGQSLANHLRRQAGLAPVAVALLREAAGAALATMPDDAIARLIQALPLDVTGFMGIERAISSAGGVAWDALDAGGRLLARPDCWVCGEMLDWEAPTGGYLLQACFAQGRMAGEAVVRELGLSNR